jgi:hypothetical protein
MRISKRVSEDFEDTKGATQWPKEKIQKDKQRSTKHTYTLYIYAFIKMVCNCDLIMGHDGCHMWIRS